MIFMVDLVAKLGKQHWIFKFLEMRTDYLPFVSTHFPCLFVLAFSRHVSEVGCLEALTHHMCCCFAGKTCNYNSVGEAKV